MAEVFSVLCRVGTDNQLEIKEFRDSVGAECPFLVNAHVDQRKKLRMIATAENEGGQSMLLPLWVIFDDLGAGSGSSGQPQ